jgi:hypothetical protein
MTQNELALLDVAVHEAGHAVVAHVLGVRVIKATINDSDAFVRHRRLFRGGQPPSPFPSTRNRARAEKYCIIAMAGDIAERRFNPARQPGDEQDRRHVQTLIGFFERSNDHGTKWIAALEAEADAIVGRWWDAVKAVAVELARRGVMNGRQITECIKSVLPLG